MSMHGAVDLGALAASREAAAKSAQAASAAPEGVIKNVTTQMFQSAVIEQSTTVPVVIDLWASWCGPCKQLTPVLEKLAVEYAGRFVLAKVDVDAEQQIAAAFQVQSIPSVFAVLQGQPLPLFQGAYPEAQVRQVLDALLAEAEKIGVVGRVGAAEPEPQAQTDGPEPEGHPGHDAAFDAIEAGDWAGARAAYASVLASDPSDVVAASGLRLVALYERNDGTDPAAALAAAPDDLPGQLRAADAEAISGEWAAAFDRLIGVVRRTPGEDRAAARQRLLELFEVAGPDEPSLAKARVALANALF